MSTLPSLLAEQIVGERCLSHVTQIGAYDRSLGSSGYGAAAGYVEATLAGMGLEHGRLTWPMDGSDVPWNWSVPRAWEPTGAAFRVISPETRTLVNFVDTPTCIHPWSAATPPEGVTAEVVYVGEGLADSDYEGVDVAGKIVFADRGANWLLYHQAVEKRGALGYLSDDILAIPGLKTRDRYPDMVLWYTLYEREITTGQPNRGWGLSISPRMGDYLRDLLATGPVMAHCQIDAETFDGTMEVVYGTIPGEAETGEEFVCMAHLDHYRPGATDNASGCAVLLEAADVLARLIASGELPPPRRPIRFLFGPEGHVSNIYPHQLGDEVDRIVGSWTVDTVGATPEVAGGPLLFLQSSAATPTFLNDLGTDALKETCRWYPRTGRGGSIGHGAGDGAGPSPFKFEVAPYGIHSDNSCIAGWGVPAVGLVQWPSVIWHTQYDTPDRLDDVEMARCAWATAYVAYQTANAGPAEAHSWMHDVAGASRRRLAAASAQARRRIHTAERDQMPVVVAEETDRISYLAERDTQAVASCLTLVPGSPSEQGRELVEVADDLGRRLAEEAQREASELGDYAVWHNATSPTTADDGDGTAEPGLALHPRRVRPGLINMKYQAIAFGPVYSERDSSYMDRLAELMNLADGRRSIAEIARIVGHEMGPVDPKLVLEMYTTLAGDGFVMLGEPDLDSTEKAGT